MKISSLASKYEISKDALYFYISKGLLIPRMSGKQYIVDDTFERDLQLILKYRDWGFSLNEIHSILSASRKNSYDNDHVVNTFVSEMLLKKADSIRDEISGLREKLVNILAENEKLLTTEAYEGNEAKGQIGVPLSMVSLLRCPVCGGSFSFSNSDMSQTQIINADVTCSCGYCAKIKDGIFITPNKNQSKYDHADVSREIYNDIPDMLVSLYQKSYYWMEQKLENILGPEAVVMETHLNDYFYLQYELGLLEKNKCRLILVDKFPEILEMYKAVLERQVGKDLEVLLIADAGTDLPICSGSVDVFVDFFASNEHHFFNSSSLIEEMAGYVPAGSYVIGTYFSIAEGRESVKNMQQLYPESCSENFNLSLFKRRAEQAGYTEEDKEFIGETSETGENYWCFGFVDKNEKIRLDSFLMRKSDDDKQ